MIMSMKESTDYTDIHRSRNDLCIPVCNLWMSCLAAGAGFSCRRCQLASAGHCINSARNLWFGVIENLRRNSVTIRRRQHVIAQLSFGEGAGFVELVRSDLKHRFARYELL